MVKWLCKCGCGEEIIIKPHHKSRGIPSYILGHHNRVIPNGLGKKRSQETKDKISKSKMGTIPWNKGKTGIYSKETLQKIANGARKNKNFKGKRHTAESNEKNRIAHLGKTQTTESNKKRSLALTGKMKTKVHKQRIAIAKIGAKNPAWRGGISVLPYTSDWTDTLRAAIRQRDGHRCYLCNIAQDKLKTLLDVHHIDYDKENCDPKNLITLCKSCHRHTNYKRNMWEKFFSNRMSFKKGFGGKLAVNSTINNQ